MEKTVVRAIEYQHAKDLKIVHQTVLLWLQNVDLPNQTIGKLLKDWHEGRILLNIPSSMPIDKKQHRKYYLEKYLEKVLFKL